MNKGLFSIRLIESGELNQRKSVILNFELAGKFEFQPKQNALFSSIQLDGMDQLGFTFTSEEDRQAFDMAVFDVQRTLSRENNNMMSHRKSTLNIKGFQFNNLGNSRASIDYLLNNQRATMAQVKSGIRKLTVKEEQKERQMSMASSIRGGRRGSIVSSSIVTEIIRPSEIAPIKEYTEEEEAESEAEEVYCEAKRSLRPPSIHNALL